MALLEDGFELEGVPELRTAQNRFREAANA
jgi:hypothetical protein